MLSRCGGSIVEFAHRNSADSGHTIVEGSQGIRRKGNAANCIDQPVAVDEIPHGRVIGREPSSRLR